MTKGSIELAKSLVVYMVDDNEDELMDILYEEGYTSEEVETLIKECNDLV